MFYEKIKLSEKQKFFRTSKQFFNKQGSCKQHRRFKFGDLFPKSNVWDMSTKSYIEYQIKQLFFRVQPLSSYFRFWRVSFEPQAGKIIAAKKRVRISHIGLNHEVTLANHISYIFHGYCFSWRWLVLSKDETHRRYSFNKVWSLHPVTFPLLKSSMTLL